MTNVKTFSSILPVYSFILLSQLILHPNLFGDEKKPEESPAVTPPQELSAIPIIKPAITLTLQDASHIFKFFAKNAWSKSFMDSNLYRGLVDDLGPVFLMSGNNLKDAWSGRLIDFLSDQLLSSEPIQFHYFARDGLISPMGIGLPGMIDSRLKALSGIIKTLVKDPLPQSMYDDLESKEKKSYLVRPLHMHSQKFAAFTEKTCLALSRDPRISIATGLACDDMSKLKDPPDALLNVHLADLFPQIWSFVSKFYGFKDGLTIAFKYQAWDHFFRVTEGKIPVAKLTKLKGATIDGGILDLLPAQTVFFATLVSPVPETFTEEGVKNFLLLKPEDIANKPHKPVTLAAWERSGKGTKVGSSHVTALIFSDYGGISLALDGLPKVFAEKSPAEIKFDLICNQYLVVTPYLEALEDLRKGCEKKVPTLSHKHPNLAKKLQSSERVAIFYFNFGIFMTDSFQLGINITKEKGVLGNPEITETQKILGDLPTIIFSGSQVGDDLQLQEIL